MRLADDFDGYDDVPSALEPGRLFLWFPVGLALRKARGYLRQTGRPFGSTQTGALAVEAPEGCPEDLLTDLADLLTDDESSDTRCVFKPGPADLEIHDIARVRTLADLRRRRGSAWLVDILRANRLTSVFQPIVHSAETTRVLGHEALVRGIGHDGHAVTAGSLFDAARGCGMVPELDLAARHSAIAVAAAHEDRRRLFINVTPDALRDGGRGLAPTADAIDAADIRRDDITFELTLEVKRGERAVDVPRVRRAMDAVRGAGFRVALDDVGCADDSRRLVHELRPDFVKVDMRRLRQSPLPLSGEAERMLDLAQRLRVETIASGVETVEELEWNRRRGADYVQGFYIGRPSAL